MIVEHAKFLFDSTFVVNWGSAPASGLKTKGSFHELIVPALLDVFNKNYTLSCNQNTGRRDNLPGCLALYRDQFLFGLLPRITGNGSLDWHTWLLGMDYINGNPHLYAIMQFIWEP